MKPWLCLLAGLLLCSGCSSANSSGSTLVYTCGTDADTLDPLDTSLGESAKVIVNVYDTLVAFAEDSVELVPALAERWEVDESQRNWTFYLRPNVTFHDGTPLTAEAVVMNFQRMLDENHPLRFGAKTPYVPHFEMIADVKATGPLTVQFELKQPSAVLLNNLAMFSASIVSPAALEKYGRDIARHPVGTGPFQFDSWQRDQRLALRAYDAHWRGRPKIDRVVFIPVPENAMRAQMLIRGGAHLTDNLPPAELASLEKNPQIRIQRQPGLSVGYLAFQMEKPPLNDRRVRQAIYQAIDKQRLINVAFSGSGTPATTLIPPNMWGHHEGLSELPYDPAAAKQLLAQTADELGLQLPLRLNLYYMKQPRPYMQQPRQVAIFLRDALAPIGIEVSLVANDYRQHFQRLSAGEHHLGLAGWTTDNADPDNFLYSLLDQDSIDDQGGNNVSRYRNEQVHELLIEAQSELDQTRREQLYRQAQELIFADIPVVALLYNDLESAQRAEVQGYQLHPMFIVRLRQARLGGGAK